MWGEERGTHHRYHVRERDVVFRRRVHRLSQQLRVIQNGKLFHLMRTGQREVTKRYRAEDWERERERERERCTERDRERGGKEKTKLEKKRG